MIKRKIVEINKELCNGCGICVDACHEGALQMVNGKAKLMRDDYCDGLGDCLPECPTGAISIIEREAAAYDDEAVKANMRPSGVSLPSAQSDKQVASDCSEAAEPAEGCGCPGSAHRVLQPAKEQAPLEYSKAAKQAHPSGVSLPSAQSMTSDCSEAAKQAKPESELRQWPVQLRLVSTNASFLQNANLLIAADCTPFAYADFHRDLLAGKVCIIACPKLDDYNEIVQKLTGILASNNIASVTVARMEVPCCGGLTAALQKAIQDSGKAVPFLERVITVDGKM